MHWMIRPTSPKSLPGSLHARAASVGSMECSDGQVLTEPMRLANELADTLAKRGAEAIRRPLEVRRDLQEKFIRAKEVAMFVGRVTALANSDKHLGGDGKRDSEAIAPPRRVKQERAVRVQLDTSVEGLYSRSTKLRCLLRRISAKQNAA